MVSPLDFAVLEEDTTLTGQLFELVTASAPTVSAEKGKKPV